MDVLSPVREPATFWCFLADLITREIDMTNEYMTRLIRRAQECEAERLSCGAALIAESNQQPRIRMPPIRRVLT